jgi:hypothetical protein
MGIPPDVLNLLEHHGTKGMRWGVRKSRSSKTSSDYRKTQPHRGKKPSQLSNKQLQEVNKRINLEQNYSRMNPTRIKRGAAVGKGVLAAATTATTIYTMVNSPAGKAAIAAGKKALQTKKTFYPGQIH